MYPSRRSSFRFSLIAFLSLAALLMFAWVTLADNTGPPVITFRSEGGYVSGTQSLEAYVDGDMADGVAMWSMDADDDGSYQEMDDAGAFWAVVLDMRSYADGPHTLYVKAWNTTGVTAVASLDLDVDNHSPSVAPITTHGTAWGDFVFEGEAEDAYLNESAVYCLVDGDEAASRANLMSRTGDRFRIALDTTQLDDGDHLFRVWAFDLWGNSNKSQAVSVLVSNRANLVIEAVDWKSTSVSAGDEAVAKVTVRNEGGTAASGFDVAIVEGDKVRARKVVSDTIEPGETTTVNVGWSAGKEGKREVTLRLDTGNAVDEGSETDNTWPETQSLDFEGGAPGPGALVTIVATGSVAGLLARRRDKRWRGSDRQSRYKSL